MQKLKYDVIYALIQRIITCCIVQFPGSVIISTIVLNRIILRVMIIASGLAVISELLVLLEGPLDKQGTT